MKTLNRAAVLAAVLSTAAMPAGSAGAPEPAAPYEPLAFLVGHCWKGTFPDGQVTDEHCFSWVYGGKFVRDEHVVHRGGGKPDDRGESIYFWDSAAGELQYLYIESAGGYSRGSVAGETGALVFPATHYFEHGVEQVYRSRWQRGTDAYDVNTEFLVAGKWQTGFTLHMQRVKS